MLIENLRELFRYSEKRCSVKNMSNGYVWFGYLFELPEKFNGLTIELFDATNENKELYNIDFEIAMF